MPSSRRTLLASTVATSVAALLVGCLGDGDDTGTVEGPDATPTPDPPVHDAWVRLEHRDADDFPSGVPIGLLDPDVAAAAGTAAETGAAEITDDAADEEPHVFAALDAARVHEEAGAVISESSETVYAVDYEVGGDGPARVWFEPLDDTGDDAVDLVTDPREGSTRAELRSLVGERVDPDDPAEAARDVLTTYPLFVFDRSVHRVVWSE